MALCYLGMCAVKAQVVGEILGGGGGQTRWKVMNGRFVFLRCSVTKMQISEKNTLFALMLLFKFHLIIVDHFLCKVRSWSPSPGCVDGRQSI